jgi:hypothetical protein
MPNPSFLGKVQCQQAICDVSPATAQLLSSLGGVPRIRFMPDSATSGRAADGAALPAHGHAWFTALKRQGVMSDSHFVHLLAGRPRHARSRQVLARGTQRPPLRAQHMRNALLGAEQS